MNIPLYEPYIDEEEVEQINDAVKSGWISSSGKKLESFESEVKNFLEVKHGYAVDSGTAALHTALEAVGVSPGDKVIIPGLTFGATALAVRQAGAEPVPVDIEEERMGLDPESLDEELSKDISAVVVVHLFGKPAKMRVIKNLAQRYEVPLVEDSAQAFGSEHRGEKTGTLADAGAFSFSWNKSITTGKGGFVVTDKEPIAKKMEQMVSNGKNKDGKFSQKGYHYRMDSLRASVGISQMEKFQEIDTKKREIQKYYFEQLNSPKVNLMQEEEAERISPWIQYILSPQRESILEELQSRDIGYRKFYPPVSDLGVVESSKELPKSKEISQKGLILPSHPGISDPDIVVNAIRNALGHDKG